MNVTFTEKLIQEIKKRPILYLLSHPDNKNKAKKLKAWREVQTELNEEVKPMKAKWKNLRDTYKKFKQSRRISRKKLSNWVWAEHMSFIDSPDSLNDAHNSLDLENVKVEPNDVPNNDNSTQYIEENWEELESTQESSGAAEIQETYKRKKLNNSNSTHKMIQYQQNKRRRTCNRNNDKVEVRCDGVDLLFLGYANTFKNLSNREKISVKFDIGKMLMEAELRDLQENVSRVPAVPRSSSSDSSSFESE